jgi:deoxyribodipyrimidine photo-lyase
MIVASFLVKDLHIDWHLGEAFFAQHLTEFDPAVNNGNWQWAASTGCDAQPYFRIFNPWAQQKRFDPNGEYVKRWVPELTNVPPARLHRLDEEPLPSRTGYPTPIVEHARERRYAIDRYSTAAKIAKGPPPTG